MPNSYVHVFNVSGLPNTAPTMTASIPITPISGTESPCKIDCSKEGWLEQSLDGRYLFVGNSGSIIDTTTDQVVANLNTLSDIRMFLEVDWVNGGNAGIVSGGADVIGVQQVANDWLFAEGYTGGHFQENFVLANLDPARTAANVTITLEYNGGSSKAFSVTVTPLSQVIWNVNANSTGAGSSQSVSAEITSSGAQIAVEREMYFGYDHVGDGRTTTATGGSDVLGQVGPATVSAYSFAEGYTNLGYDEWLTIQNPTATTETVNVTVSNGVGTVYTFAEQVVGHTSATAAASQL